MHYKRFIPILIISGMILGYSILSNTLHQALSIGIKNTNNIPINTSDATYQFHSYKENFNDFGDHFTNSSGSINVTCGIGKGAGGLQLNYTPIIINRTLPPDKDNWTEDVRNINGVWGNWFLGSPPDSLNKIQLAPGLTSPLYVEINFSEVCDNVAIIGFQNETGTWNLSQYDQVEWFFAWQSQVGPGPTNIILREVRLFDISLNCYRRAEYTMIPYFAIQQYSRNLSEFIDDPGFDITQVLGIEWEFTYNPICVPQWYLTYWDVLYFIDFQDIGTYKETGIWYSDWINLPENNMLWTELIIDTSHPDNTTIEVSIDNTTFIPLDINTPNLGQFLVSRPIILRIRLEQTATNGTPFIDYVIIMAEPILAQLLELFGFLIPKETTIYWIISTTTASGVAIILAIYVIYRRYRKTTIVKL